MNIHVIHTEAEMYLSKNSYPSWRDIQDEYHDYRTSLGPWGAEETEAYLNDEYPDLLPSASKQIESFIASTNLVHLLTFT